MQSSYLRHEGAKFGVLYDYFRARLSGGPPGAQRRPARREWRGLFFDGIDGKGIDPTMVLGQFIAIASSVPWSPSLVPGTLVGSISDEGPWLTELGPSVLGVVADIDESRLTEICTAWSKIDELALYDDVDPASLSEWATGFIALARRAKAAGDQLYCWCCL